MTDDYLSKYVELAALHKIRYKIVFNKDYNTDLGLSPCRREAINQENIYIEKKINVKEVKYNEKQGFWEIVVWIYEKLNERR